MADKQSGFARFQAGPRFYYFEGREDDQGRTGLNINHKGVYFFENEGREITLLPWSSVEFFETNDMVFQHFIMNVR